MISGNQIFCEIEHKLQVNNICPPSSMGKIRRRKKSILSTLISELLPEVRNYWSVFNSQLNPNGEQVYQIYSCTLQLNAQILKNVQQQTK